jgi:hypothetical protein
MRWTINEIQGKLILKPRSVDGCFIIKFKPWVVYLTPDISTITGREANESEWTE